MSAWRIAASSAIFEPGKRRFLRIGITVIFIYPGPFENLSTVRCVALPEIWVDPLLELSGDIWPAIRLDELAGKAGHSAPDDVLDYILGNAWLVNTLSISVGVITPC